MVMAIAPILVVFGRSTTVPQDQPGDAERYLKVHNSEVSSRELWASTSDALLGILGVPRRYYAIGGTDFIPASGHFLNE